MITISPTRRFGSINIDCTIEETHTDALTITDHPVEQGAAISDHAYRNPAQVVIKAGWTNSGSEAAFDENYVRDIYAQLLALQQTRVPFDIVTGKRTYRNMLFTALAVTTDEKTEAALMVTATCREVILVKTRVVTVSDNQAEGKTTGGTEAAGNKQLKPSSLGPS